MAAEKNKETEALMGKERA